jgi:hypothetical protein
MLSELMHLDIRVLLLWHSVCPVALYLQQEPWAGIVRAALPLFLTTCTMAQSDQDLDLAITSLKAKKYGLKGP